MHYIASRGQFVLYLDTVHRYLWHSLRGLKGAGENNKPHLTEEDHT